MNVGIRLLMYSWKLCCVPDFGDFCSWKCNFGVGMYAHYFSINHRHSVYRYWNTILLLINDNGKCYHTITNLCTYNLCSWYMYCLLHIQYKNERENIKQKLQTWNLFPLRTKRQHLNFMCLCKCLPSPVHRGVKGLRCVWNKDSTKSCARGSTYKNNHFAISSVNSSAARVCFAISGNFATSKVVYQLGVK